MFASNSMIYVIKGLVYFNITFNLWSKKILLNELKIVNGSLPYSDLSVRQSALYLENHYISSFILDLYIIQHQRVCHNVFTTSYVKGQGQKNWFQLTTPCPIGYGDDCVCSIS